jgi:hypothetical protein
MNEFERARPPEPARQLVVEESWHARRPPIIMQRWEQWEACELRPRLVSVASGDDEQARSPRPLVFFGTGTGKTPAVATGDYRADISDAELREE